MKRNSEQNPNPAKAKKRISGHLKTINLYAAGITTVVMESTDEVSSIALDQLK